MLKQSFSRPKRWKIKIERFLENHFKSCYCMHQNKFIENNILLMVFMFTADLLCNHFLTDFRWAPNFQSCWAKKNHILAYQKSNHLSKPLIILSLIKVTNIRLHQSHWFNSNSSMKQLNLFKKCNSLNIGTASSRKGPISLGSLLWTILIRRVEKIHIQEQSESSITSIKKFKFCPFDPRESLKITSSSHTRFHLEGSPSSFGVVILVHNVPNSSPVCILLTIALTNTCKT